jgi:hypothetical protein
MQVSVAVNASSHRPEAVSLREDDIVEDFKQALELMGVSVQILTRTIPLP